jgi:hypothetical protein
MMVSWKDQRTSFFTEMGSFIAVMTWTVQLGEMNSFSRTFPEVA